MNTERDFTAFVEAQLRQVPRLRAGALSEILGRDTPAKRGGPSSPLTRRRVQPTLGATLVVVLGVVAVLLPRFLAGVSGVPLGEAAPSEPSGDIAFVQASYEQVTDHTLRQAPGIFSIVSEGGVPVPVVEVPGDRWTLAGGSFPNDPRNRETVGPAVRWSPDGTQLAFRLFNDAPGIYVMGRDGGDLRRLVDLPMDRDTGMAFSAGLDWSPDGTRIAYTYPYTDIASPLYVVDIDGGRVTDISGDDRKLWVTRTLAWSPDGSRIAFARTDRKDLPRASRLFLMDADGSNVRELPTGPERYPQVEAITWSPDGSAIAFVLDMNEAGRAAPERGALRVVNQDGSGLRTLAGPWQNGGCCVWSSVDGPLAWSPDGTSIAMLRTVGEDPELEQAIVLVDSDGSGERLLTPGSWFDWSPDGSRLVVSDAGGWTDLAFETSGIRVIDADGTDLVHLADGEYPAWAPGAVGD